MMTRYDPKGILVGAFIANSTVEEKELYIIVHNIIHSAVEIQTRMTSSFWMRMRYARQIRHTTRSIQALFKVLDVLISDVAMTPSRFLPESMQPLYKLGIKV